MSDQAYEPAPARVSFGPKEWQSVQPEVASMILTLWCESDPEVFGYYYALVMACVAPSSKRARNPRP